MADRPTFQTPLSPHHAFLRRLQDHTPNSTQLTGLLTLLITGLILLLLTGLTVTGTVIAMIFFSPLIIIFGPIWIPIGTLFLLITAAFLSMCGFGIVLVTAVSWMYRYFRPGSDRMDYARSRIYNTATHVKDYAREYSDYLQSKVKDAAPGA
ncbi:oleosin G-like [Arachis stenosperma]|uniref:oleosin G-like n=1 Tax=Arachis stenosperma TaxID=217475 RepID=UPI0025ACDE31|nr:oleosin G-like [Arachis stenosperma]